HGDPSSTKEPRMVPDYGIVTIKYDAEGKPVWSDVHLCVPGSSSPLTSILIVDLSAFCRHSIIFSSR
ncbi:hypothetical protein ACFLWX_03855, partial [Chloroflexota bacterium]